MEPFDQVWDRVTRAAAGGPPSLMQRLELAQVVAAGVLSGARQVDPMRGATLVDRVFGEVSGLGPAAFESAVVWPRRVRRVAEAMYGGRP